MNATVFTEPYKDRRTALLAAGIIEIVMGVGAWLMAGLLGMIVLNPMLQQQGVNARSMIPGMIVYGFSGTAFIVLGIGSIRLRRWARSMWVVISGGWLFVGVMSVIGMLIWVPMMFQNLPQGAGGPPPAFLKAVMLATTLIMSVVMIVIPLGLFLFYRSRHVQATVEAAQASPSWTDRCTLPLLAAVLWLATTAAMLLILPFSYGGFFPFFGMFVRGPMAFLLWWATAGIAALASIGLYRRSVAAWWASLALIALLGISASLTYAHADLTELYEAMGLQGVQLEQIQQMGLMRPGYMVAWTVAAVVPFIFLLIWARPSTWRRVDRPTGAGDATQPSALT